MTEQAYDQELDCQGLLCPLPIIKTKQTMDKLAAGQVLRMLSTDAGSVNDVQAWVRQTGNELLSHSEDRGIYTYYLRKK